MFCSFFVGSGKAVDEEDAVDVVVFVENNMRFKIGVFLREFHAVFVHCLDDDSLRPFDIAINFRNR